MSLIILRIFDITNGFSVTVGAALFVGVMIPKTYVHCILYFIVRLKRDFNISIVKKLSN